MAVEQLIKPYDLKDLIEEIGPSLILLKTSSADQTVSLEKQIRMW